MYCSSPQALDLLLPVCVVQGDIVEIEWFANGAKQGQISVRVCTLNQGR